MLTKILTSKFSAVIRYVAIVIVMLVNSLVYAAPAMPPTAVSVTKAMPFQWQQSIKETGTLIAPQGVVVSSEVDGRITQIFFHSGQTVNKGNPLIQLNPDVIKAQLAEYQAELKLAHLAYGRSRGLNAKHFMSQADYDQAEANFHSAQAKVAQAQAMLAQTLITAPFTGKLGLRQVSVGDYVKAGQGLINLQTINPIFVNLNVPEMYLAQLHNGMTVNLQTATYPNQEFQGKVFAFESLIDVNTRTLAARATVPNNDGHLLPGAFVEVQLLFGEPSTVLRIPQIALVTKDTAAGNSGDLVYVVKDGHAILTPVKVLARHDNNVLIGNGLADGDLIVTAGQIKLQDKAAVTIAK